MEAYPPDYVVHNLPLLVLAGLVPDVEPAEENPSAYPLLYEKGTRINCELPLVKGEAAKVIRKVFDEADGGNATWNSRSGTSMGYRVKNVGRSYIFPPRKAYPPPASPSLDPSYDGRGSPPSHRILHSPLSPLTPTSSVFPDGIMSPYWVTKHQDLVPAALICFFTLKSDPTRDSAEDNRMKSEINHIRSVLVASGYKTKLVVVLVGDSSVDGSELVEERLITIRKATNLDPRTSFFFIPPDPPREELRSCIDTLLTALHPSCVEYYRDLSKHARRKRNRNSVPPPTAPPISGTSQTLPSQGWSVRYEFKLGIFAEFRQEMDAACRNYEGAYNNLLGPDVFEIIAGWSPRFDEARLLADVIAIRIIRCLLWNGQTSSAVRLCENHKNRLQYLVDNHGKGSANYGWAAWEARWNNVMAQLIERADLPIFRVPDDPEVGSTSIISIYSPPEKTFVTEERFYPWEMLHHEGYWLNQAVRYTMTRRRLAHDIPDEDRQPPGQSPASVVANKAHLYDTYLCPEPHIEYSLSRNSGFNHSALILSMISASIEKFSRRNQIREVEHLKFELGKEYLRQEKWDEALNVLRDLWVSMSWRQAGWWFLVEEVGWAFRRAAVRALDKLSVLAVDWELMNHVFSVRPNWAYDLRKSLGACSSDDEKVIAVIHSHEIVSCMNSSVVFEKPQGNVGEPLNCQLIISASMHKNAAPIQLSGVKIEFKGHLQPVYIQHSLGTEQKSSSAVGKRSLSKLQLQSPSGLSQPWKGSADLTFSPGEVQAFDFQLVPREPGNVSVTSITLCIDDVRFQFDLVNSHEIHRRPADWWYRGTSGPKAKKIGKSRDASVIKVLPKPPKLEVELPNLERYSYTDELVQVAVKLINGEEEAIDGFIVAQLSGPTTENAKFAWMQTFDDSVSVGSEAIIEEDGLRLHPQKISNMDVSANLNNSLMINGIAEPGEYALELSIKYHLVSDPTTPLIKNIATDLVFNVPFEAPTYNFSPRLYPFPWPDFFSFDSADPNPGLVQRWSFTPDLRSLTSIPLFVTGLSLIVDYHSPNITCILSTPTATPPAAAVLPQASFSAPFIIDITKPDPQSRHAASLTLSLAITWRRASSETTTTTNVPFPVLSFPLSEPRCLLVKSSSPSLPHPIANLTYTLENPSNHALTFALTLETSPTTNDFAFSGPKAYTVQVLPFSRTEFRSRILDLKSGAQRKEKSKDEEQTEKADEGQEEECTGGRWIDVKLSVLDVYFQKNLRVWAASEGVRNVGKAGDVQVWVGEVDCGSEDTEER